MPSPKHGYRGLSQRRGISGFDPKVIGLLALSIISCYFYLSDRSASSRSSTPPVVSASYSIEPVRDSLSELPGTIAHMKLDVKSRRIRGESTPDDDEWTKLRADVVKEFDHAFRS